MSYGQNRPNYHNGSHNMHNNHGPNNVVNIPSTVSQSQQQPTNISSKIDTNIGVQSQSNSQTRYKTMDSSNLGNQQQQQQPQQHKQPHASQKPSNSDNVLNLDIMEMNHGCVDDQSGLNVIATSTTSSKTKTPMCLINELARANQVGYMCQSLIVYVCLVFFASKISTIFLFISRAVEASVSCGRRTRTIPW